MAKERDVKREAFWRRALRRRLTGRDGDLSLFVFVGRYHEFLRPAVPERASLPRARSREWAVELSRSSRASSRSRASVKWAVRSQK